MPELAASPGLTLPAATLHGPALLDALSPHTPPRSPVSDTSADPDLGGSATTFSTGVSSPRPPLAALDALVSRHDSAVSSSPVSQSSRGSRQDHRNITCVVCMDNRKDIALAPCEHTHCCLACFRRAGMSACPICRTPVTSIIMLSSGMRLPVSPVALPAPYPRSAHARSSAVSHEPVPFEVPHSLRARRSMPHLPHAPSSLTQDDLFQLYPRSASVSSHGVATQAESSVRSLPRSQDAVFRQLRETGSVSADDMISPSSCRPYPEQHNTPCSTDSSATLTSPCPVIAAEQRQNMVLIGHSKRLLVSLAHQLMLTFPPTYDRVQRSKSTVYINGEPIRLVLVECPMFSMGPDLVARIQRQSPKLVLLCADYFNVSSFESIVRLDMEMLDYLSITSVWVLVKSTSIKRPKKMNIVEESDVQTAKHFLSKPRKCFIAPVDGPLTGATTRKLGLYIYMFVSQNGPSGTIPASLRDRTARRSLRSWSFLCIRSDITSRKRHKRPSISTSNLGRWLC